LFFVILFVYGAFMASDTRDALEQRLASQTVTIEQVIKPKPAEQVTVVPPSTTTPDSTLTPAETATVPSAPVTPVTQEPIAPAVAEHTDTTSSAPLPELLEETPAGKLPRISDSSNLTPFKAYTRPFAIAPGSHVIALAVQAYGISKEDSEAALSHLPKDISFILSPYASDIDTWRDKARVEGREIWLYMPLENKHYPSEDQGPKTLMANAEFAQTQQKLDWILSRTAGYAGVVAETDEIFSDMHANLEQIIKYIYKRGLGYAELNPGGSEFIETLAVAGGYPFIATDNESHVVDEDAFLAIEEKAKTKGMASAVITLNPQNLEYLSAWINTLSAKGFTIAPLSAAAYSAVK
jgi:polysaccharide deacetylase 2 family uncharacterized protein YibQ